MFTQTVIATANTTNMGFFTSFKFFVISMFFVSIFLVISSLISLIKEGYENRKDHLRYSEVRRFYTDGAAKILEKQLILNKTLRAEEAMYSNSGIDLDAIEFEEEEEENQ